VGVGLETLGTGSLCDQDRGVERAAARLSEHLGTMHTDEVPQVALDLLCFAGQHIDSFRLFTGDANSRCLRHRSQTPCDPLQLAG
jgi:hypothetical protein